MILLDTHVLLWLCVEPQRLSRPATTAIKRAVSAGGVAIASISLWEIAMLIALGRLSIREPPEAWIARLLVSSGVVVKDLTPAVAVLSTQFPADFPHDPADRLIAATARVHDLTLATRDRKIRSSTLIQTIW
ncbi:MAG: type II toxin-antitoxin system VapC family toxin [Candidatus Binatia bacterium]